MYIINHPDIVKGAKGYLLRELHEKRYTLFFRLKNVPFPPLHLLKTLYQKGVKQARSCLKIIYLGYGISVHGVLRLGIQNYIVL